ncbi:MAG TPA: hypothetical protein DCY97_09860 [Marinilabiliales bacterium]|jgi:hypothetical protein|nr:hypothetical protein [Marinilabiliales bacterium]
MKKKKWFKIITIVGLAGLFIGGSVALYLFNMPHRDVQSGKTDFSLTSNEIVSEYLANKDAANQKYLAADGDSKILKITGTIAKISENYDGNKVVLLKENSDKAGVSATFTPETNQNTIGLSTDQTITVKGVIRSGASYDDDLELYENVILEESDIVKK